MVYNCIFSFFYVLYINVKSGIFAYTVKHSLRYLSNFKDNSTFLGIQENISLIKLNLTTRSQLIFST